MPLPLDIRLLFEKVDNLKKRERRRRQDVTLKALSRNVSASQAKVKYSRCASKQENPKGVVSHNLKLLSRPCQRQRLLCFLSERDAAVNDSVPSAGQGMTTLVFATRSMMESPGSAKEGASVRRG